MSEYQVQTDVYNGPMDLLLFLIRREEVDLYDIPMARITEQYCRYVEMLNSIDPNVAGDFLVMAATLMELKSRMLLPRPVAEDGEPDDLADPRLELVRQLLEYKRFKDASLQLGASAELKAARWPRAAVKIARKDPAEVDLEDAQIWDLVAAFNKLMSAITTGPATHDVIFDDTPIALHAADIIDRLQAGGGEMTFEQLFQGRNKVEMIGLFLALLELMRQRRIRVKQPRLFAPIKIVLVSTEPIEVGEEWESAFREAVLGTDDQDEARPMNDGPRQDEEPIGRVGAVEPILAADVDEPVPFVELDAITTDVDIDAILQHKPKADESPERGLDLDSSTKTPEPHDG